MTQSYFITGTDTDVGKTHVACALLHALNQQDVSTAAYKPIAAGCEPTSQGLRNRDALLLQQHSSVSLNYNEVNPIAYAEPVAPHLAAERQDQPIDLRQITSNYQHLLAKQADILLTEGAGGWRLPLGQGRYLSDFVIAHKIPVILVVGIRLGCLNHALLTTEAIRADGLPILGWVANCVDPDMPYVQENIHHLQLSFNAPMLAQMTWGETELNSATGARIKQLLS